MSAPIVSTIGVNGINATYANVVGSINPNGLLTSWWAIYGVSIPLSPISGSVQSEFSSGLGLGSSEWGRLALGVPDFVNNLGSSALSIGSGTVPVTVTYELSGLKTGVTYYVAIVGQNASGTVIGETISFVPQVPTTVLTQPSSPYGQPFVTIPHFDFPFRLITSGTQSGAVVVEQDTLEEVRANVNVVVSCGIGQCLQLSTFGVPQETFMQAPPDTSELVAAIQQWEPRASEDAVTQLMLDGQSWGISLMTSYTGAQGT